MRNLVAILVQTDRFGTSIGQALRVHADSMRTTRRLKAEELAAKLPVKLLLPLIFFIFPSMFIVVTSGRPHQMCGYLVPGVEWPLMLNPVVLFSQAEGSRGAISTISA